MMKSSFATIRMKCEQNIFEPILGFENAKNFQLIFELGQKQINEPKHLI